MEGIDRCRKETSGNLKRKKNTKKMKKREREKIQERLEECCEREI